MRALLVSAVLAAAAVAAEPPPPADLVFANHVIVTLRATAFGISPQGRVAGIRARLRSIVEAPSIGEVAWQETPEGVLITVGGEGAFRLLPEDVDPLSDETLLELRDRTVANLKVALAEVAEARSVPRLLRAIGYAIVATALLLAFLAVLRRLVRWLLGRLETVGAARIAHAGTAEFAAEALGQLRGLIRGGVVGVGWLAAAIAAYLWLFGVLEAFPYTRAWGHTLGGHLVDALRGLGSSLGSGLPGLLVAVVIVIGTRWLVRVVQRLFDAVERGWLDVPGLHPDTMPATRRIASVMIWLFALALAYPFLPGSGSTAFQGVTVFAGLMITIGSGAFVGHVLAGYMIIYSRSFRVGDYVRIGDTEGTVASIGMFTTKIQTLRREIMSFPNSVVFSAPITNYTLQSAGPGIIVQTAVTIGYGAPWRQVEALLLRAVERTPGLEREPRPFVRQRALSDFYVEYLINAFLKKAETRIAVLSDLHAAIQDAFNEAGVQIMSPHYEADTPEPVVVPKSLWNPDAPKEKG